MSLTTAVDFLLSLFQVEGQSIAGCVRFFVFLIKLLVLRSLDLTANNRKPGIKCQPETNDSLKQECLSLYSAETRSSFSLHFLAWFTTIFVLVLWGIIIFYNKKQLPKIKRADYRKKEALCCEFWNKSFLHVCSEAVVVAVSLAYLCYTQKMYLTESTFYCRQKNNVTCSIEHHRDIENSIIIVIGGMTTDLLFCMLTICFAICNKEVFIKDLVNSSTDKEEGKEKRKKWTYAENVKVVECYYKSKLSGNRGYRQTMLDFWIEEGMFVLSKERLAGQAQSILTRKLLSQDVLKEIRDRVGFQEEEERQGQQDRCQRQCKGKYRPRARISSFKR